jgi:hypothetical protein
MATFMPTMQKVRKKNGDTALNVLANWLISILAH